MTGKELQTIRRSLGLTQAQLAERLELSPNSIARYEMPSNTGQYPVPKWLAREMNWLITQNSVDRIEITE